VVFRNGLIFLAKVHNKGVKDILVAGDDIVLRILYLTDGVCLTTLDHFQNTKEGWFLTVQLVLVSVVQHDFLQSSSIQAHNFSFMTLECWEFCTFWDVAAQNVINALMKVIFHQLIVYVMVSLLFVDEYPEVFFLHTAPTTWLY